MVELGCTADGGHEADTRQVASPPGPSDSRPGAAISRYVILEELGRGAMGRVLRAYDPKLQREVAIKELPGGVLDRESRLRLLAEARAMAKLSHPNVVGVYDSDQLPGARLVLVMELVDGGTLLQWQRESKRSWREIVERYVAAGRGLVAAHEAGLLHRDFKPANVLVADAAVKVTDFGLAKATSADSPPSITSRVTSGDEGLTEAGTVLGTLRYMAPEQHKGDPLTPAADQYALCVALWEALCGSPPFSGESMARDKMRGPPPWPEANVPKAIAAAVHRGLAPRPEQRWPSIAALLDALSRDPALGRSRWMAGGALVATGVLGALWYQGWVADQDQRCDGAVDRLADAWGPERSAAVESAFSAVGRSYVRRSWEQTQRELDLYAARWVQMHTEACEATAIHGQQPSAILDLRMACLRRASVELRETVNLLMDADEQVLQRARELTARLPPLSRCADIDLLVAEVEPPRVDEVESVEAVRSDLARGKSLQTAGLFDEALVVYEAARTASKGLDYGPVKTEVAAAEGELAWLRGEYPAAEEALLRAIGSAARWRQPELLAEAGTNLVRAVGFGQRRIEEGVRYLVLVRGLTEDRPLAEAQWRDAHATLLQARGDFRGAIAEHQEALALREESLGPDHPQVAESRSNLAVALFAASEFDEAERQLRLAVDTQRRTLGEEHPFVGEQLSNLGALLYRMDQLEASETEHRAAVALLEAALESKHPTVATARNNLAATLLAQQKFDEAAAEFEAALAIREEVLGPEHPSTLMARSNLASLLLNLGRYREAEVQERAVLRIRERTQQPSHPDLAGTLVSLADSLRMQEKYDEAEPYFLRGVAIRDQTLGPAHPSSGAARQLLASNYYEAGRYAEALEHAELVVRFARASGSPPKALAADLFLLAQVLDRVAGPLRDRSRARRLAVEALELYRQLGPSQAWIASEIEAWLRGKRAPSVPPAPQPASPR